MYSRLVLFLLASILVISTAFGQKTPKNAASDQGWTVTAETPVSVGADQIQGLVTFERDDLQSAETRRGGTCLAADLNDGTPCESDSDCSVLGPPPERGFRYCGGANGSSKKICWTRPGGTEYCYKSPANLPGTYATPIVSVFVNGQRVKWIDVACMAVDPFPTGCGSSDVHAYSQVFNDEQ